MEVKEQEKFLEIKKEVIKIIRNKEEKLEINNIKLEVIEDKENSYIIYFESDKVFAQLIITTPGFAPYYYACFNILWLDDDDNKAYWWLDEENSTILDITENIDKSLDYFVSC